ncbi:MAG: SDR family oxidoreductase [Saonia sp.]
MKVIVFGSTGTIGKHVIDQALDQGHKVLAFCREAEKLKEFMHPNLKTLEGDVLNPIDVSKAVKGQDVVCVVLGSGKKRKGTVRSEGTRNIIDAMKEHHVQRLICQSTLGAGNSQGNLNFFWKYIMFGWFLKPVFLDHELQEKYVMESNLDWTLIRPAAFVDGERTKEYRHGFHADDRSLKLKISRADVADFILRQIGNNAYLHKTPGLSY